MSHVGDPSCPNCGSALHSYCPAGRNESAFEPGGDPRIIGARAIAENKRFIDTVKLVRDECAAYVKWKIGTAECAVLAGNGELDKCGAVIAAGILDGRRAPPTFDPRPLRVTTWLAETLDTSCYAVRGVPGTPAHLTPDPLKATRFASKADALDFCHGQYARFQDWTLVAREHVFMGDEK